jgi:hypothetical protein
MPQPERAGERRKKDVPQGLKPGMAVPFTARLKRLRKKWCYSEIAALSGFYETAEPVNCFFLSQEGFLFAFRSLSLVS